MAEISSKEMKLLFIGLVGSWSRPAGNGFVYRSMKNMVSRFPIFCFRPFDSGQEVLAVRVRFLV